MSVDRFFFFESGDSVSQCRKHVRLHKDSGRASLRAYNFVPRIRLPLTPFCFLEAISRDYVQSI